MASFLRVSVSLLVLSQIICFSSSAPPTSSPGPRPPAVVLPVIKDVATNQYVTIIQLKTPTTQVRLLVDLAGIFTWVACDGVDYVSSSFRPVHCVSQKCDIRPVYSACGHCESGAVPRPECNPNACTVTPLSPYSNTSTRGEFSEDAITVHTTDGVNPRSLVTVPDFTFACTSSSMLQGFPVGVTGLAGFSRNQVALPSQLSHALQFPIKFALCLPSSGPPADGVIFIGNGPYHFFQGKTIGNENLLYTPLLVNRVSTAKAFLHGEPSYEHFIQVNGVRVNGKDVALNTTLLSIAMDGQGGTKLSTVDPYSVLETSIYEALTAAFTRESGLRMVAPVAPFGACYDGWNVESGRLGPSVPTFELVLQGSNSSASNTTGWVIWGSNSMVQVKPGVLCLGFVDGGKNPTTAIGIGGYQLQNNLLQFDVAGMMLGISGSLLFQQTTCSNFNHTSFGP